MRRSLWIYTLIAVGLCFSLARSFQTRLTVHPYVAWVAACSIITWAFYAWDKRTAELGKLLKGWRVPEITLHLLALLGGFLGAWVGRAMFDHKTNVKRHPSIVAILIVSMILHALFVIRLLYGPPLVLWPPDNWLTFLSG
jgi:uncharacterized membrane protein YsdA (DUF1294 family)